MAIKGPLTTPVGGGIRSLNVALRQMLDLYACVRPVRYFTGVPSPVKRPENVNMVIFRENTEDIYAGIEYKAEVGRGQKIIGFMQQELGVQEASAFPHTSGIGIKPISRRARSGWCGRPSTTRIAQRQTSVTLVHKGNIMKFTEGAFRDWGYQLAREEYGAHREWMAGPWCATLPERRS